MTKGHADEVRFVAPFGVPTALAAPQLSQQPTSPEGLTTSSGSHTVLHSRNPHSSGGVVMSSPSKIVSCSLDGLLKMWNVNHEGGLNCICTLDGHTHRVHCLDVQDSRIISGCWDKTIKVWEFPLDYLG